MKKNGLTIILVLIILALCGYLVYDKVYNKGSNEQVKDTEVTKDEEVTDEVKKFNEDDLDKYVIYRYFNGYLDEEYKKQVVVGSLNESDYINFDCSEYEGSGNYKKEEDRYIDFENFNICTGKRISYDTLNNKYHELFGGKAEFSKDDFSSSLTKYVYYPDKEYFELFIAYGTGIEDFGGIVPVITNIEYKDNKAIVDAKVAKYECYGADCAFDGVITDEGITPIDFNLNSSSKSDIKKIAKENYMDKFEIYEFTFYNENENYKLESIELKESN